MDLIDYIFESQTLLLFDLKNQLQSLIEPVLIQGSVYLVYIKGRRSASHIVNILEGNLFMGQRAALQNIEHFTHITSTQSDYGISCLVIQLQRFQSSDFLESLLSTGMSEWPKSEPGASRLQSWNDLGHIVANETEPSGPSVLLHNYKLS